MNLGVRAGVVERTGRIVTTTVPARAVGGTIINKLTGCKPSGARRQKNIACFEQALRRQFRCLGTAMGQLGTVRVWRLGAFGLSSLSRM